MSEKNRKGVPSHIVFYLPPWDYYYYSYSDLSRIDGIKVFWHLGPKRKFFYFLWKVWHSAHLRKYVKVPFDNLWFPFYNYQIGKVNEEKVTFVFFAYYLSFDYIHKFISYLRVKYPQSVFVCYYGDLISSNQRLFNPNKYKHLFDYFITYDEKEAKQYGIGYYPTVFSDVKVADDANIENSDVYFIGAMKEGRWETLLAIYEQLSASGLKCDFNVVGLPEDKRKSLPGIHYVKELSYYENLQHVRKTRCVLELQQKGAVGATLRLWEAIHFGKAIITNNLWIRGTQFADERFVSLIKGELMIDVDFVKEYKPYDNMLKEKIRPGLFAEYVNEYIERQQGKL